MKRLWVIFLFLSLVISFTTVSQAAILNLRATWTANTETDMKEYKLYRTDGTRTLIGTIPHPTVTYNFSITVVDGSAGTLVFVLTASDISNNVSADSLPASYTYNLDSTPPTLPRNLAIDKP